MRKITLLLVSILFVEIGLLFYTNRAFFFQRYDSTYWKNRYEHSQWVLPLSQRTLGDNGLYAYEGYMFARGADPTLFNAEIPPLSRYIIGLVITYFGNTYWYGVGSALLTGFLVFLLAKKILKSTLWALVATILTTCSPLFVTQWPATMLDMLQLSALLLFFLFLPESSFAAGIALGIFSSMKYPIFTGILLPVACYSIWKQTKSIPRIFLFCTAVILVYLAEYTHYFLLGHTLLDWLRVQKWMFFFWFNGKLPANFGSIWTTLLTGQTRNLFSKAWESVPEWNLALSGIAVLSVYALVKRKSAKRFPPVIAVSISGMLLFYSFTAFWTRYLLLLLPFLVIAAITGIRTIRKKQVLIFITVLLLGISIFSCIQTMMPTPEADVRQFVYDWEHGFFQDMYERFTVNTKEKSSRNEFLRSMQEVVRDGEIEAIDITIPAPHWRQFTTPQFIHLTVTYHTRNLGALSETIQLPVVNENGQWRIPWQPSYFIPELSRGDELSTTVSPAKRGTITDTTGQIIAKDTPGSLIWITPQLVDTTREQAMLKYLETLFGGLPRFSAVNFYHRYSVNSQPDWPVPIGILPIDESTRAALLAFPGISLTPALGRSETLMSGMVGNTEFTECCSYLYTTTSYDGISGLENTYNTHLKGQNGGSLVILDSAGSVVKTLIQKEKQDGEDISL